MRFKSTLTAERLREVVSYDPVTGVFLWCLNTSKTRAGQRAGKLKAGYRMIGIDNVRYQAAALAWFWTYGEWPARNIKFADSDRDNTAIVNLSFAALNTSDKEAMNAYHREYWRNNPEKRRDKQRKSWYGVTPEQYGEMLLAQNGVCACCGLPEAQFRNGKPLPLCVDHCHAGAGVRGLLCHHCNTALGHFKDNVETLRAAIAYLEAHAAKPKTNVIPLAGRRTASGTGE